MVIPGSCYGYTKIHESDCLDSLHIGSVHNTLMNSGQFDDVTDVFYPTLLDAYTSPQEEEGEEEE